jgi:hypothetical protein
MTPDYPLLVVNRITKCTIFETEQNNSIVMLVQINRMHAFIELIVLEDRQVNCIIIWT